MMNRRQLLRGFAAGAAGLLVPERFARGTPSQQMLVAGANDPTADSNFSSVSLLLHFDGSNGGTTFTDHSSYAQNGTRTGTPTTSTTQTKFGTAAGSFTRANSDGLSIANLSGQFAFGTGDITCEVWIYGSMSGSNGIFTTAPAATPGSYGVSFYNATGRFLVFENWAVEVCYWDVTQVASQWNHIAWVRISGVYTFYYNGILQTKTVTGGNQNRNYDSLQTKVGQFYSDNTLPTTYGFNSYMDDMRITKGIGRYTANFTPRTTAFPNS